MPMSQRIPADSPPAPFPDVESWAAHYVASRDLLVKLQPPPIPDTFRQGPDATPFRLASPGRPPQLYPAPRKEKSPKAEGLVQPRLRARMLHRFFHHELQAAELMCWALLAFCDAEPEFRGGLLRICTDEIRHMNLYRAHIERLGFAVGDFGIRDWFWKRVPTCPDKVSFVALMGMGIEAANLEYAPEFARRFRAVGDTVGADLQDLIAKEELAHVAFATHWFRQWTGGCEFDQWLSRLPPPISPAVLRGAPIARDARLKTGMAPAFVDALAAYVPRDKGRPPADRDGG